MDKKQKLQKEIRSSILPKLWQQVSQETISPSLTKTVQAMRVIWSQCDDFIFNNLTIENETEPQIAACWLNSIINPKQLQAIVFRTAANEYKKYGSLQALMNNSTGAYRAVSTYQDASKAVAEGQAVLFFEQESQALSVNVANFPKTAFLPPENELTVDDPHISFINNLALNMGAIRSHIHSPNLKFEQLSLGTVAHTNVAMIYLEGIIEQTLVDEMRRRLNSYQLEGVIGINYIKEVISDNGYSPFPLLDVTERPDRVATVVLQGRIAVMVDGSSMALIAPTIFINMLNSIEDYYSSYASVIFIRILRHLMYWISMLLPSIYIVLLSYHPDLLPTPLLLSIQSQHVGIPFPIIMEVMGMAVVFESIREAGIRLPKAVGQSVSIVGALVIGDAAIQAGLVSPGAVITVAFAGIASFTIPSYTLAYTNRILQFGFMFMASIYGFYGLIMGGLALVAHLVSLKSFGVPYMSPVAPFHRQRFRYAFYRPPWGKVNTSHECVSETPTSQLAKINSLIGK